MSANPVLVEATRGPLAENLHRGAWCVTDAAGAIVASAGDIDRPIYPRSAIKPMQALAMIRAGAVERFGLGEEEIAIACASHRGEEGHLRVVERLLARIGASVDDLACGVHPPAGDAARKAMAARGETAPTALHNNCSGKHAGMLAAAKALGAPMAGYEEPHHPVQARVRDGLTAVTGVPLDGETCGIDGCSLPAYAAPLRALATGMARMTTGEGLAADIAAASRRIVEAAIAHPFLIAGTGTLNTVLMTAFGDRLLLKSGADGVHMGAFRDSGLGFALKIDDGAGVANEVAVATLIGRFGAPDEEARAALARFATQPRTTWKGRLAGEVRARLEEG